LHLQVPHERSSIPSGLNPLLTPIGGLDPFPLPPVVLPLLLLADLDHRRVGHYPFRVGHS